MTILKNPKQLGEVIIQIIIVALSWISREPLLVMFVLLFVMFIGL